MKEVVANFSFGYPLLPLKPKLKLNFPEPGRFILALTFDTIDRDRMVRDEFIISKSGYLHTLATEQLILEEVRLMARKAALHEMMESIKYREERIWDPHEHDTDT